ncbi:hypothetical protein ACJX0J_038404 [Zea mays]
MLGEGGVAQLGRDMIWEEAAFHSTKYIILYFNTILDIFILYGVLEVEDGHATDWPICGFARIVNNEIIILGNDAELGSGIDPEEAQHALEIVEADLINTEGMKELNVAVVTQNKTIIFKD